ncbi:MAG: bifunctional pyrazinamidase/nicotinamidase [Candidatus Hydrogenedentota bacterium]
MDIQSGDALIVVDMQNDFCPGGALPVKDADCIIPGINAMAHRFNQCFYTRDWHPPDHCSFSDNPLFIDGSWPSHCVQGTFGAEFHPDLRIPEDALIVSKAAEKEKENYSDFDGTRLAETLRIRRVKRVFVCGIATDYCVRATVLDAIKGGFQAVLLEDLCKAIDPQGEGERALQEIREAGAAIVNSGDLS